MGTAFPQTTSKYAGPVAYIRESRAFFACEGFLVLGRTHALLQPSSQIKKQKTITTKSYVENGIAEE